jgi:hypothetical protein
MEQISPNNAIELELYNSLTNSCSHSAGMKKDRTHTPELIMNIVNRAGGKTP